MPHEFLNDFLSTLQDAGELVRIMAPVDGGLEVAAITDRICKLPGGGSALFFGNVKNSSIPVVTNLLGSRRRVCLALGIESLDQLAEKMNRLLQPESGGWLETLRLATSTTGLTKFAPRIIKTAVCQQVVKLGRDVNLWELPIPRCWPLESNPVITAGIVVTQDLSTSQRTLARFPIQVLNQTQLVPHWNRYHAGYRQWQDAVRQQKQFPVAIALGGDPLLTMAFTSTLGDADPLLFAGFMRGGAIDLVRARNAELHVPAASEIVLEGYIDYAAPLIDASSIASATGHYLPVEQQPVIEVTGITHRANPVLPVIVPGPPPSEESWIGLALERLSLAVVKATIPEIIDIHRPTSGADRHLLFVSIDKRHPAQARQVLNGLWGSRLLGLHKMIVVVDADINVHSEHDVWFAVGANTDPSRDLIVTQGPTPLDDQTTPTPGIGSKLGIDATRKHAEEGRPAPARLTMPPDVVERLKQRWPELGLDRT